MTGKSDELMGMSFMSSLIHGKEGKNGVTSGSYLIACWLRSISFESIIPLSYASRFSAIDLVFLEG